MTSTDATCTVDGCTRRGRPPRLLCKAHSDREWRARQGPCSVDGCERGAGQRGLCSAHYQRWRTGGDWQGPIPERMKRGESCSIEGCGKPVQARGHCAMHYQRLYFKGDAGEVGRRKAVHGAGSTDTSGYRYITVDGQKVAEHRHVMAQMLGRPLRRFETPHHLNGRRADNRPENLELWVKPQPAGQRLEDLVEFMAAYYREEVLAACLPGTSPAAPPLSTASPGG